MISKDAEYDTYKFIHLDRVHLPILKFVSSQSPQQFDIQALAEAESKNYYPILFKQIEKIDKVIYDVIQTLKYESIYDNTLIILAGDHGLSIPPKWRPGLKYALYEEHIRVPYIVKWPNWFKDPHLKGTSINKPHNATIEIYKDVLRSLNIDLPGHFANSSQTKPKYDGYAFTETIYHPKNNNYAVSVVSKDYKYWMLCNMDWQHLKLVDMVDDKLFTKDEEDMFNENLDCGSKYESEKIRMNGIAMDFLHENLELHTKLLQKHNR